MQAARSRNGTRSISMLGAQGFAGISGLSLAGADLEQQPHDRAHHLMAERIRLDPHDELILSRCEADRPDTPDHRAFASPAERREVLLADERARGCSHVGYRKRS